MANEQQAAKYRLEKARQCAISAKNNIFDGDYEASVNRSYYAIFHTIRAVMVLDGIELREDSAAIAKFHELYISTGKFDAEFSKIIQEAFDRNTVCKYEDFYVTTKHQAEQQRKDACAFLEAVEHYIENELKS